MIPRPEHVEEAAWERLPADLQRALWAQVRAARSTWPNRWGPREERQAQLGAFAVADRRRAWRERGAKDSKDCPKGCGTRLLWRYEQDHEGKRRRVGVDRAGRLHTCEGTA